jgi:hypothetical protein
VPDEILAHDTKGALEVVVFTQFFNCTFDFISRLFDFTFQGKMVWFGISPDTRVGEVALLQFRNFSLREI